MNKRNHTPNRLCSLNSGHLYGIVAQSIVYETASLKHNLTFDSKTIVTIIIYTLLQPYIKEGIENKRIDLREATVFGLGFDTLR